MDEDFLRQAIRLAEGRSTHPNPRVGAVIVRNGEVVAEGFHAGPGTKHAEVAALSFAQGSVAGSTMYVTLEPCSHHGRTPPCADTLIEAAVSKVVIGALDPDPLVAGQGVEKLRAAGIEVVTGILESEARALDPGYFHHRVTRRPRVTIKAAVTLDGNTAAVDGTSQWITSPEARQDGHRLRAASDAVLIGAGTLLNDDPELTVRLDGYEGPQPRPIIVAGQRALWPGAKLFAREPIVLSAGPLDLPGENVVVPDADGGVDLLAAMRALGERGIVDMLVEGGARVIGSLARAGLVDRGVIYIGNKFGGGTGIGVAGGVFATLEEAIDVHIVSVERVGPDLRVEFEGS